MKDESLAALCFVKSQKLLNKCTSSKKEENLTFPKCFSFIPLLWIGTEGC
jgi:hypothetical protein